MSEKTELRGRDFRTALFLIAGSLFFLWRTSLLPFFKADAAGVDSGEWYNSAALVPFGIFGAMLLLSIVLLAVAVRDGGAGRFVAVLRGRDARVEAVRVACVAAILTAYIAGLVPRVDFILSSALVITALTWGFHGGRRETMTPAVGLVLLPALYAVVANPAQADWAKPWDDDIVALASLVAMTAAMFWMEARRGRLSRVVKATPAVAVLIPLTLVLAMAFGFRQNVPNRSGLIFSQIEYHYYVTLRPILRER